jgi:ribosomal protein L37AE/L43A
MNESAETSYWTCASCGVRVASGMAHLHPTSYVTSQSKIEEKLDRIIALLERMG